MTKIVCSFVLLALFTWLPAYGQVPGWEAHEKIGFPTPVGLAIVSTDINLALTSDAHALWAEYENEILEFEEWFEETKEELEDAYNIAQGDPKIKAARDLIEFILEAVARWERIKLPKSGTWSGIYKLELNFNIPNLPMDMTDQGTMTINLSQDAPGSHGAMVEGDIKDGHLTFKVDMITPEMTIPFIRAEGKWDANVLGLAVFPRADLIAFVQSEELEVAAGMMGIGGYAYSEGGQAALDVFIYDDLGIIYLDSRVVTLTNAWEIPIELKFTGRYEEFEYQEYLEKYFKQYVATIDSVKTQQFSAQTQHDVRRDKAMETFWLLTDALALGEAANVRLVVIDESGLALRNEDSLFDKWYGLWFPEAMACWDKKVTDLAGQKEAQVDMMLQRYNFVTQTIMSTILDCFISIVLIEREGLYNASELVDENYEAYYIAALHMWVTRVQSDPLLLELALKWIDLQMIYAHFISEECANRLGLTSSPTAGEQELRNAAGGG